MLIQKRKGRVREAFLSRRHGGFWERGVLRGRVVGLPRLCSFCTMWCGHFRYCCDLEMKKNTMLKQKIKRNPEQN